MPKPTQKRRSIKHAISARKLPVIVPDSKEPSTEIQAVPDILLGRYSNLAVINHTKREFNFDFIYMVASRGSLVARIATSPAHAKQFYEVLGKNLARYESTHGKIETE
jgi:hypothetical protein